MLDVDGLRFEWLGLLLAEVGGDVGVVVVLYVQEEFGLVLELAVCRVIASLFLY